MAMTTSSQSVTPSKSKHNNTSSGGGGGGGRGMTPTKRRPETTPRKKIVRDIALSLSPPLLRTPQKTAYRQVAEGGGGGGGDVFSSHYSSDRFIPNRSAMRVDICQASVESVEKNLGRTFDKLSRRQHEIRMRSLGENGDPNSQLTSTNGGTATPTTTPTPGTAGGSPSTIVPPSNTINVDSAVTPLQAEFNRRMRGALLNIPMDDMMPASRYPCVSSISTSSSTGGVDNELPIPIESSSVSMLGGHNRENVESIVYASLSDDESQGDGGGGGGTSTPSTSGGSPLPPRRGGIQRMLSFQGSSSSLSAASLSYRTTSSGTINDDVSENGVGVGVATTGISTPRSLSSTPRRDLTRQISSMSSRTLSPVSSPHCRHHRGGLGNRAIDPFSHDQLHVLHRAASKSNANNTGSSVAPFDSLSQAENRLRNVTKSIGRRIPKTPSRILDAPELVDDYYLNLVSWSESNVLAVALGQCVYLWEADTGNIKHLLTLRGESDFVTSVSWVRDKGNSHYIAVGTNHNVVQLWDADNERRLRSLDGHSARVGALSWNQHWLSSGGRDSLIVQHDVRSRNHVVSTYVGHTQEVCGLRWNDDGSTLASGGNENLLCLWDASMSRRGANTDALNIGPRLVLTHHKAAVKALAWCPFHRGLLASGGGTADRTIKFWNTNSGAVLNSIDTGSQVCSLLWSKHQREICSSHGFSENQLILWKYPTMAKIQEFKGHTARVLHMDQSPDGGCVVSAAADETLRFWDVFGSPPSERKGNNLVMGSFCGSPMIR